MIINKFKKLNRKGMTFVEAIIGIFIFALVMLAVTNIFTSSFNGYKKADKMAKNIESAQYAMNLMAKSLRTTKIIAFNTTTPPSAVFGYNFSEGACQWFGFTEGGISMASDPGELTPSGGCTIDYDTYLTKVTSQYVYGSFSGALSNNTVTPKTMGKVTIRMKVCSEANCVGAKNDFVVLQTTVSLRDYSTVGL